MPDYSSASPEQRLDALLDRKLQQVRVCLPGIIGSFNPENQTVTATPSVKMKVDLGGTGDSPEYVPLPPLQSVPVVMPYAHGAGLYLTLPIQAGDPCLLVFADRSIDNAAEHGGIQPPIRPPRESSTMPRSHHLSDSICIPGFIPKPQAIPEYSTGNIELRDKERKSYISLGPQGIEITDGTAFWKMGNGAVSLDAPAGITQTSAAPISTTTSAAITMTTSTTATIQSSNMTLGGNGGSTNELEGSLSSRNGTFIDKDKVSLNAHTHTGVTPGSGVTKEPVK